MDRGVVYGGVSLSFSLLPGRKFFKAAPRTLVLLSGWLDPGHMATGTQLLAKREPIDTSGPSGSTGVAHHLRASILPAG